MADTQKFAPPLPMLLKAIPLFVLLSGLGGCYSMSQLYHQGNLLSTRQPIKVLIWQKNTPKKLRQDLQFVTEVLAFAKDAGLNTGRAYRTYIDSGLRPVSYIVNAAEAYELKAKKWWFPLIGRVPYLGFYHRENRNERAAELRQAGYDVNLGAAGAFSSLGWYDDPIYRSMLRRPPAELAHLLFHELTHRTFWMPSAAKLNENLAEFIAGVLIEDFLISRQMPQALVELKKKQRDQQKFRQWLKALKKSLVRLYAIKSIGPKDSMRQQKAALFKTHLTVKLPKFESDYYDYVAKRKWNNATVLNHSIYEPQIEPFTKAYTCMGANNVGVFLRRLEKNMDSGAKALKALDMICQKGTIP